MIRDPSLVLTNTDGAVLESGKFLKYLFNKDNQIGYAKGVAFSSRRGYNIDNEIEAVIEKTPTFGTVVFLCKKGGGILACKQGKRPRKKGSGERICIKREFSEALDLGGATLSREAGGYFRATAGKGINFMMIHKA